MQNLIPIRRALYLLLPVLFFPATSCTDKGEDAGEVTRLREELDRAREELAAAKASPAPSGTGAADAVSMDALKSGLAEAVKNLEEQVGKQAPGAQIETQGTANIVKVDPIFHHSAQLSLVISRDSERDVPLKLKLHAGPDGNWVAPSAAEIRAALVGVTVSAPSGSNKVLGLGDNRPVAQEFPTVKAIEKDGGGGSTLAAENGRGKINKFKGELPFGVATGNKNTPSKGPTGKIPPVQVPAPVGEPVRAPGSGGDPPAGSDPPAPNPDDKTGTTSSKERLPSVNKDDVPVVKLPGGE